MDFVRKLSEIFAHLFKPRRSNNHRSSLLHPEALFFLVIIISGFVALLHLFSGINNPNLNILGYASSITPKEVIKATNEERARIGLEPLQINEQLTAAAINKGENMFAEQYWSHTAPDGTEPWTFLREAGYEYHVAGENLARDFDNTKNMVSAWMASPTHRANIVNPRYSEIGIAVIDGELQGYKTTLVVQMFGVPSTGPAAPTISEAAEAQTVQVSGEAVKQDQAEVLASALVPGGEIQSPPLFTPLQLTKAFFLAVIMLITTTLVYDAFVIGDRNTLRLVGQNMAHIFLFLAVMYLVIFFKGGVVG